jgi:hypothetical protein
MAAGPSPFPAAEKDQNAAAAPDAIKVNALAWSVPTAPAEAEKKVNGDFVLRPKLMNSHFSTAKNTANFRSVNLVRMIVL